MVTIKIYNPEELNRHEWRDLQTLSRDAFSSTLDRSAAEIDAMVAWDDPAAYYESHMDPNKLDRQRHVADQTYFNPRVVVGTEAGQLAGYAYSSNNVSGEAARDCFIKRIMVHKNYLLLGEFAVAPSLHRYGYAKKMGAALLRDAIALQPPVAYVWPDETSFLHGALERLGFVPTGEKQVKVFGDNSEPVRQVRLQAPTVRGVLQRM